MKRMIGSILVLCLLISSMHVSAASTNSAATEQKYSTSSSSGFLTSLMAVQENNDLFICVTGKRMTNTYTFYIEKDQNEKTGKVIEWWSKATGDYKITDDKRIMETIQICWT